MPKTSAFYSVNEEKKPPAEPRVPRQQRLPAGPGYPRQ
jgi:hypothetical protein